MNDPATLEFPILAITKAGEASPIFQPQQFGVANRSLAAGIVGNRVVDSTGTEYLIKGVRVLGPVKGTILHRLMTLGDPWVRIAPELERVAAPESLEGLKKALLKNKSLRHNADAGEGSSGSFAEELRATTSLPQIFALLDRYFGFRK